MVDPLDDEVVDPLDELVVLPELLDVVEPLDELVVLPDELLDDGAQAMDESPRVHPPIRQHANVA